MKRLLTLVAFFATLHASAQQVNPVPDYVFRNQMSVGRGTVTDTAAYFSIGPRYGATKGFMPPIVGDTATFSSGKRNGLLIFSVQKNKFLYWDSVRVQWSDMAGSSGTYITGTGITGYVPQFSGTTTIDTSALFTIGNRLGIGTSTFAATATNSANVELNGTAGGILVYKRNDSSRGYLWHTGDNMELANTAAGAISFNTNSATRGSISSAGVWRLNNLAGTGDRVVVASSNGTLSASTSVTGLVDTTTISTRAWRQKGDDSLGAIIATKGSGTVTSVATGYGLSGGTITTTGTLLVDTLNIATRAWRQKGLDSLAALEVSGSGTTNYVPKFTAASTIGNSIIQDNGTDVGIGSNSAGARLEILRTATGAANNNTTGSIFGSLHGSGGGPSAYGFAIRHNGSAYAGISGSNFVAQVVSSSTNSNALEMYTTGASPLVFGTSATERLRITSGGNIGIGTASPTGAGERHINLFGAGNSELHLTNNTSGTTSSDGLSLAYSGNDLYFFNFESGFMSFGTSNAERLRIFANGRIGVNTTTDAGYQFDVNGTLRSVNGANFATSSGNVGIGTASPAYKLTVKAATDYNIGIGLLGGVASINALNDAQSAYTQMRIDATNLLINTYSGSETLLNTSSDAGDYKLQVSGNIYNTGSAVLAANGTSHIGMGTVPSAWSWPNGVTQFRFGGHIAVADNSFLQLGTNSFYDGSNYVRVNAGYSSRYLQNDGGHFWSTAITSTAGSTVTFNEQMRMTRDGELLINTTTDAGDYKLQVAGNIYASGLAKINDLIINGNSPFVTGANVYTNGQSLAIGTQGANLMSFFTNNTERGRINSAGEWIIDASGTDAGDYKLQVVGNARVGTGKLDIASNTTFGLGIARSGTSEVAGQIYNSNGILYTGVESSAGGQIFSGSSAYAAVIGSGANYPLQFAVNNITRGGFSTSGNLLLGFTTDSYFLKLQVNGSIFSNNQFFGQGPNAQLSIDSSTNISPLYVSAQSLTGTSAQAMLYSNTTWNTTGNPSLLDLNVTNTASGATSNYMKITDGTNTFRVTKAAEVVTAAPTGGSIRKWKLGEAATVSPTSPNRTIRVEIDGTVYYLHAKTTND